jgi:hypothetical protein
MTVDAAGPRVREGRWYLHSIQELDFLSCQ